MQPISLKIQTAAKADKFSMHPMDNFNCVIESLLLGADHKSICPPKKGFTGSIKFIINQGGIRNREVLKELKADFRDGISELYAIIPQLQKPFSGKMEILVAQDVPKEVRFIPTPK